LSSPTNDTALTVYDGNAESIILYAKLSIAVVIVREVLRNPMVNRRGTLGLGISSSESGISVTVWVTVRSSRSVMVNEHFNS